MMKMALGALVFLASLCCSMPAHAKMAPAPYIDWLPIFEKAGIHEWGNGKLPDCGPITYRWADLDSEYGFDVEANNNVTTCEITWDLESWPYVTADPGAMCLIVNHELGHLYGEDDDPDDPDDIMYGTPDPDSPPSELEWQDYEPCRRSIKVVRYVKPGNGRKHGGFSIVSTALRPRTP